MTHINGGGGEGGVGGGNQQILKNDTINYSGTNETQDLKFMYMSVQKVSTSSNPGLSSRNVSLLT